MVGLVKDEHPVTARLLLWGVIVSALFLASGVIVSLWRGTGRTEWSLRDIPAGLLHLEPGAFIHAGLIVLLLTPLTRVAALGIELALRRETSFALLCAGILLLLGLSIAIGAL